MAKEIIPPDPIPVGENEKCLNENYCATFMDYSDESYSETSKKLLQYLESEYDSDNLGGSTRTFIARNMTKDQVINGLSSEFNNGFMNIYQHVCLTQNDDDVIIVAILY